MAVIQAYVDDSGGKGQGEVFVFSALISASGFWESFSDKWQACLDESPKISYFKMYECVGLSGQFARFSPQMRDERLRKFCKIINEGNLCELPFMTVLKDFEGNWANRTGRPLSEPYFFPFHMTILAVAYQVLNLGVRTPFEIFFDEHVIFGPRAKAWYPVMRSFQEPIAKEVLPVEPFFRSDKDVLPLQAADLTAWMQRTHNEKGFGEFEWLKYELRDLARSPFAKILDGEMIRNILNHDYSPEEIERNKQSLQAYQETFGHEWPPKNKSDLKKAQGRK